MEPVRGLLQALLVVAWLATPAAMADIYILTQENGEIALSNIPVDSRYQLLLTSAQEASSATLSTSATSSVRPHALAQAMPYASLIEETAKANNMEAALLHAVIRTESGHNPRAASRKGAAGLMQLMPETAKRYGVVDRYDPADNVRGGARYLKDLLKLFNNDIGLTLAAYNAGEKAVARHGNKIPPYPETTKYVEMVMKRYDQYLIQSR